MPTNGHVISVGNGHGMGRVEEGDEEEVSSPDKPGFRGKDEAEQEDADMERDENAGPSQLNIRSGIGYGQEQRWKLDKGEQADGLDQMITGIVAGTIKEGADGEVSLV